MSPLRPLAAVALALGLGLAACSSPTAVEEEGVAVTARDGTVEIRNARSDSIFVRLVERETAPLVNMSPCPLIGICPIVAPGGRRLVGRAEITGVEPDSEEAILHWWRVVPDGEGGFELTDVHGVVFPLR